MSYYWFNRQELLHKAGKKHHNCDGKEKVAEYYRANKYVIKEKANNKYRNLSEEKKKAKRQFSKNRCNKMKENAKQNTNLFLQYKDEQTGIKT